MAFWSSSWACRDGFVLPKLLFPQGHMFVSPVSELKRRSSATKRRKRERRRAGEGKKKVGGIWPSGVTFFRATFHPLCAYQQCVELLRSVLYEVATKHLPCASFFLTCFVIVLWVFFTVSFVDGVGWQFVPWMPHSEEGRDVTVR